MVHHSGPLVLDAETRIQPQVQDRPVEQPLVLTISFADIAPGGLNLGTFASSSDSWSAKEATTRRRAASEAIETSQVGGTW